MNEIREDRAQQGASPQAAPVPQPREPVAADPPTYEPVSVPYQPTYAPAPPPSSYQVPPPRSPSDLLAEAVAPPPLVAPESRPFEPPPPPRRPAKPKKRKLTWSEQRYLRRRQRHRVEEILGWIFVPLILIFVYWFAMFAIGALGTSPEAIMQAFRSLSGGGAQP